MVFRERLGVPVSWWGIGLFFGLSFVVAVGVVLGPWFGVVGTAVVVLGLGVALWWYGSVVVIIDDQGVHAGNAVLEWPWVGQAVALDEAATRQRLRAGADPRAYLVTRGYVRTSVEITVADPDDPHPFWLVSSRRPAELAEAISVRMPR
ncbi:MAG: DUF3093 domain-containing protein [Propionicimonas sp.]|uniref:DUF3093 domain-containing protein n=1 Tax=Propionicimonas sp. TaxID=1955623 RepID=UPI002B21788A|nr:DUF3093 domain-containing protein [Propionicimonas sp.]MEA4943657.1 DUF3093 domain-containing protein [Propionicimonas sp.]MEA5055444.1 DUF3093 domain-containing protein [Propionicimonas sp.]MEA5117512.1 DUF3093 domain-containing protein [Propionicimonas sp.]